MQYWRSVEQLYAYASDPTSRHRPAWAAFNRRARRNPGAVGVWHETYPAAGAETVYVNTPSMGLAGAVGAVPVSGRLDRARDRLDAGRRTGERTALRSLPWRMGGCFCCGTGRPSGR